MTVPKDFEWVRARAEVFAFAVFDLLRKAVKRDVELRNEIPPKAVAYADSSDCAPTELWRRIAL